MKFILHWIPPIPIKMQGEDSPTGIRPVKNRGAIKPLRLFELIKKHELDILRIDTYLVLLIYFI